MNQTNHGWIRGDIEWHIELQSRKLEAKRLDIQEILIPEPALYEICIAVHYAE